LAAEIVQVTLHRTQLHYRDGLTLHTASSGSVAALDALYLQIGQDRLSGVGEVRINIAYLNGLAPYEVISEATAVLPTVDWTIGPERLINSFSDWSAPFSAPLRMLVDCALHDLCSKRAGVSVARWLGAETASRATWPTNQTLFWSNDETMLARAGSYVARGFKDLKLRVGIGSFDNDLRRIDLLRAHFGPSVKIAVDANGQWPTDMAQEYLNALAQRAVAYVEQPVAAGDWDAIEHLAQSSPLPIMLDESVQSHADVGRICSLGGTKLAAHLKLVKLGGIAATVAAARRLAVAGVPFMIGQMNEGGAATAAALHVACATRPGWAELYGADGLYDDPVSGLVYEHGAASSTDAPGLGVTLNTLLTQHIQTILEN
jgi:L-alanine-DL-glutamate epimerase-like enolase superfamily enzyme